MKLDNASTVKSLVGVIIIVGLLYWLNSGIPNRMMLQGAIYVLTGVLVYHLYTQFEDYYAQDALKKLMKQLYVSFPEGYLTDADLKRKNVSKSTVAGLVKIGCLQSEGKGRYVLGENSIHIMNIWQTEHLNKQIFVLTIALLVVSIIVVLTKAI